MAIFEQGREIIVAFGTGDVTVSTASPVKDGLNTEVVFSNATAQRKIGEVCEEAIGVRTDELEGPVIRLQFNKLDSLRVVEDMLLAVKRDMEAAMGDKKSRKMKDKLAVHRPVRPDIQPDEIEIRMGKVKLAKSAQTDPYSAIRLAKCWNILRTMTDAQLVSLEKQVDATIEEVGEDCVGVYIGPTLSF